jgi:acetolactate decarboxylase
MNYFTLLFLFFVHTSLAQTVGTHSGAMSQMAKENFKATIMLDTLNKSHLFGIGPYGKMQGEITVLDGKPYIAQVLEDGLAHVSQNWKAEAPFFVFANVNSWNSYPLQSEIKNMNELQLAIEKLATEKGLDLSSPFPFRIRGTFTELTIHVVTPRTEDVAGYKPGRNQENYSLTKGSGELLGFYSQNHQGIYTHKDSFIHVHFINQKITTMGHVDKIANTESKLTVLLPSK